MDMNLISVMGKQLSGNDYDVLDVVAVVLTGISVVFAGLVILIVLVMLYGKIFESVNKSKAEKAAREKAAKANAVKDEAPAVKPAPKPAPAAVIESGIEEETVAVIMAAISAYGAASGKTLRVAGIKRAAGSKGSANAWSSAARAELTRPF